MRLLTLLLLLLLSFLFTGCPRTPNERITIDPPAPWYFNITQEGGNFEEAVVMD